MALVAWRLHSFARLIYCLCIAPEDMPPESRDLSLLLPVQDRAWHTVGTQ